ncbi:MAG: hypothetical protein JNL80_03830 [Phycisphaerae bacterium]|jgi:hypothetical protein|nr:hypothetical protein [Phycisphaerae bacterium]
MSHPAYLGVGFGVNPRVHSLIASGLRAMRTVGFACANRQADGALPSWRTAESLEDQIRREMERCRSVIVLLGLPENRGHGEEIGPADQHRLMESLEIEYRLACELRDKLDEGGPRLSRVERRHEVFIVAPSADSTFRALEGYCTAVLGRFEAFAAQAAEIGRRTNSFVDASDLERLICSALFQKLPNLSEARVMISATGRDLQREHEILRETIEQLGQRTEEDKTRMHADTYLAMPHTQAALTASEGLVRRCTMYLGLVKNRITAPVRRGLTLTEIEYEMAFDAGKQCGFFVANQEHHALPGTIQTPNDEEAARLGRFLQRIELNGTPMHPFVEADDLRTLVFTLLSWMFRPGPEQQAYPPPTGEDRDRGYVAHPYILMEGERSVRTAAWARRLHAWRADPKSAPCLVLRALGGMGKSALGWTWLTEVQALPQRPDLMWWSFYADNAGPVQFAKHALWWITGNAGIADDLIARDDLDALYGLLLDRIQATAGPLLLCLDGIERVLIAYGRELKAEIAPDEGPTLDITIQLRAQRLAERFGVTPEQAVRYMMKFADRPNMRSDEEDLRDAEARIRQPSDESDFATFLRRLLTETEGRVKVFISSRFLPTALQSIADTHPGSVKVEDLLGLTPDEARSLWEATTRPGSAPLVWEQDALDEDLGGGTLAEICCESLGGYALAVSMLAELVAADPLAEGRFSQWKRNLHGFVRTESWKMPPLDAPDRRAAIASQLQTRLLLLTLDCIKAKPEEWSLLSAIMLGRGGASTFGDLYFALVGEGKTFQSPKRLYDALNRLRRWKLIGGSREGHRYDAHPVVRRALKEYDPDAAPGVEAQAQNLIEAWAEADMQADLARSEVHLDTLTHRWHEILGFMNLGAVRTAFDLFECGIEGRLRYRTQTGNVVRRRALWLGEAISTIQRFVQLKGETVELRIFRGLLQTFLADNFLLEGNIAEVQRVLPDVQWLIDGTETSADGWWLVARARLTCGHLLAAQCRRHAACLSYRDGWLFGLQASSRLGAARDNRSLRAANRCQRIASWSEFYFASDLAAMSVRGVERLERRFPAAGTDADADMARVRICIAQGRMAELPGAVSACHESTNLPGEELSLGRCAASLLRCEAAVRGWLPMSSAELSHTLADTIEQAAEQGFERVQRCAMILRLEQHLTERIATSREVATQAADLAERLRTLADSELEAEALLLAARALQVRGEVTAAQTHGRRAFRLAFGDGARWAERSLVDRVARFCETVGLPLESLRAELDETLVTPPPEIDLAALTVGAAPGSFDDYIKVRDRLGWSETTGSARKWWESFEQENEARMSEVWSLAHELLREQATITEFFLAYVYSNTDAIKSVMLYLKYTRRKKAMEARRKAASTDEAAPTPLTPLTVDDVFPRDDAPLPPEINDTSGWSDTQLRQRLDRVKASLDWASTTGSARKWWDAFEAKEENSLRVVVRLAEELLVRQSTLTEFYLAWVYSNTDDLMANLYFLEYSRLKKEEERVKREGAKDAAAGDASESSSPPPLPSESDGDGGESAGESDSDSPPAS